MLLAMGWIFLVVLLVSHACLIDQVCGSLTCPRGVQSFSTGPQNNGYYTCEEGKIEAVLRRCQNGTTYWPHREACLGMPAADNASVDLATQIRETFGENVFIGDVFDANKVQFYPRYSFWNRRNILDHTIRTPSPLVKVHVFRTNSMSDRLERTGCGLSVTTDIAGDLVHVSGSSLYLKDAIRSNREAAVVLAYEATTQTDTFSVQTPKDRDICSMKGPTHVVGAATYGLAGNFVFKKMIAENESMDESLRKLEEAVNTITTNTAPSPKLEIFIKDVRVAFFGDFIPRKEPVSFKESFRMYQSLPERVGTFPNYSNNTVKVRVELIPITTICPEKKVQHVAISDNLLSSVNTMLGELERTGINIKSLMDDTLVQAYSPMLKMLEKLSRETTNLQLKMKSELKVIIPEIRSGVVGEDKLVALLNKYEASPLSLNNVEKFLENRVQEAAMLKFVLSSRQPSKNNVKVVSYEDAIDMRTMFKKRFVLMLRFNILTPKSLVYKFLRGEDIDESSFWFNNPNLISEMGRIFDKFLDFSLSNNGSKAHGYVLGIRDAKNQAKNQAIEITAQKAGLFYKFEIPEPPENASPHSVTHDSVRFTFDRPEDTWITGITISYFPTRHQSDLKSTTYKFTHGGPCNVTISHLTSYSEYQYTVQHYTPMGLSGVNPGGKFITRACSPPSNPRVTDVEAYAFKLSWDKPAICGEGVRITDYNVIITGPGKFSRSIVVSNSTNINIQHVDAAKVYKAEIKAIFATSNVNWTSTKHTTESLPASVTVLTLPSCPPNLQMVARSVHSVSVTWSRGVFPVGSIVYGYRLQYQIVKDIGNVSLEGTSISVFVKGTSCDLTGLIEGTSYAVRVKVVTSMGTSAYSQPIIVATTIKETELEKLWKEMDRVNQELKTQMRNNSRDMRAKLQTESKLLMQTIESETSSLRKEIFDVKNTSKEQISHLKTKIEGQVTAILNRVSTLERDQDISRWKFLGFGWSDSYDVGVVVYGKTFEQCLVYCVNYTRANGKIWNGIHYAIRRSDKECNCIKDDKGHDQDDDCLHFRYI